MTTNEYKRISSLMERFFDGLTTKAEEETLYRFFSDAGDIPGKWEPYRKVFAYFENGMASECLPHREALPVRRSLRWRWTCVAAVVGLLLAGSLYFLRDQPFDPYEGSYIVRNGVRIDDLDLIRPELEATLKLVREETAEAERRRNELKSIFEQNINF
ncbi:MAG: hypothetical protein LBJ39_03415 [Tannerellaceae bacterium]|jgi:hypothetical protein|nr:hypothetical protein [Tannerellaceae bacterium]